MWDGRISNTFVAGQPLARLTIGVVSETGKVVEMIFVRDSETTDLVAQVPEVEAPAPTEDELNADYLLRKGWGKSFVGGLGELWSDPIGGGDYLLQNALDIQAAREYREYICDELSFEDTPMALEVYGGE